MTVDQFPDGFYDPDVKRLIRLVPAVGQHAVLNVRLLQERRVYERHPPAEEKEEEEVAGEFKVGPKGQVEVPDASDVVDGDRPFEGFLRSGEHRAKRFSVFGQFLFDRTVIDSPEDAHVKGDGIGGKTGGSQICLIVLHEQVVYRFQCDVFVIPEPLETAERGTVVLGGADMIQLP